MRGHSLDRILASSALALVLGLSTPALSQSVSPEETARVESRVPVPDTTLPPPITAVDVVKPVSVSATATAEPTTQSIVPAGAEAAPAMATPAPATAQPAPTAAPVTAQPAPASEPAAAPDRTGHRPASKFHRAGRCAGHESRRSGAFGQAARPLTGRNADRYFARRSERTGAEEFYKQRNYEPLFVADRKQSPRAAEFVAYLQNVDADGLDPSDYPAPTFKAGDLDALAEAELRLTGEILEYARHASIGRVHFSRISNDIGFEQDAPEPAEILAKVTAAADIKQALGFLSAAASAIQKAEGRTRQGTWPQREAG